MPDMTLKQVAKEQFKGIRKDQRMICLYKPDTKLYPDYADEYIESHGDKIVLDHQLVTKNGFKILVVELKED